MQLINPTVVFKTKEISARHATEHKFFRGGSVIRIELPTDRVEFDKESNTVIVK